MLHSTLGSSLPERYQYLVNSSAKNNKNYYRHGGTDVWEHLRKINMYKLSMRLKGREFQIIIIVTNIRECIVNTRGRLLGKVK